MTMDSPMNGKVAVVTGGSRGIGAAVATSLAEAGADVAVTARRLESLRDTCEGVSRVASSRCMPLALDVTQQDAIELSIAAIERELGPIDLLVNNAGVNIPRAALEVTEEQWDTVMDTNLKGAFFVAQSVGRRMVERRHGKIINIASAAGLIPAVDRAPYCSSKAGIVMLTRELALEWATFGVTVNAVAPTFVETELAAQTLGSPESRRQWLERIPLGRFASFADVAGAVCYLASDAADFLTGVVLPVDGGLSMR